MASDAARKLAGEMERKFRAGGGGDRVIAGGRGPRTVQGGRKPMFQGDSSGGGNDALRKQLLSTINSDPAVPGIPGLSRKQRAVFSRSRAIRRDRQNKKIAAQLLSVQLGGENAARTANINNTGANSRTRMTNAGANSRNVTDNKTSLQRQLLSNKGSLASTVQSGKNSLGVVKQTGANQLNQLGASHVYATEQNLQKEGIQRSADKRQLGATLLEKGVVGDQVVNQLLNDQSDFSQQADVSGVQVPDNRSKYRVVEGENATRMLLNDETGKTSNIQSQDEAASIDPAEYASTITALRTAKPGEQQKMLAEIYTRNPALFNYIRSQEQSATQ